MDQPLVILLALGLFLAAAVVFARPLARPAARTGAEEEARATLEAAKEAKYREIRDAELDFRMGKLSEADYRAIDAEFRAQAIEILRGLDRLGPGEGDGDPPAPGGRAPAGGG